MRVALINEFSQADKNNLILSAVTRSARKYGAEVYNTGMTHSADQLKLNYMHLGIQAFLLLNTGAVDFVITGCGSGQGACMSLNNYPGVVCGYITDPSDAFLFTQINNGNAVAMSFAKDFGWAAELKIEDICDKLFSSEWGKGYPPEMKAVQNRNSALFYSVKAAVAKEPLDILKALDPEMLDTAISGENFRSCFTAHCDDSPLARRILERIQGN